MVQKTIIRPVCMLVLLLAASVSAMAQGDKVIFRTGSVSVGDIMETVQKQTKYAFAFDNKAFDTAKSISVTAGEYDLEEVLSRMVAGTGFTYQVVDDYIIINNPPKKEEKPEYVQRTSDSYAVSGAGEPGNRYGVRPVEEPKAEDPPPAEVVPELPIPYSSYISPDIYGAIKDKLPVLTVKTNLLYGGIALAPNLGGEIALSRKSTFEFTGSRNVRNLDGTEENNRKMTHWILRPEYRWWMCERFNGHFFGVHAFYAEYNVSEYKIPLLFEKEYRYEGNAYGAGITYGYHLPIAKKWGLEFHVGLGIARLKYDRFDCTFCSDRIDNPSKTYFGPTRAGVSLVFMIR